MGIFTSKHNATCYLCSWEKRGYANGQDSNDAIVKHLRRAHGIKNPVIENRS